MTSRFQRGAGVLVTLFAGACAAAGCNFIVGVGDYTVGDSGADATSGPADAPNGGDVVVADRTDTGTTAVDATPDATRDGAGDATADAAGNATDAPGDGRNQADAARDAADGGGDAPAPGEAGPDAADGAAVADADGAPPPVCGQGIPNTSAFTAVVNACVLAVGCDPYLFPISLSDCITRDALHATPFYACLSTITSCTGATNSYFTCQGQRIATLDPGECPGSTSKCTNNVAFDCSGLVPPSSVPANGLVTDCNLRGGTCMTYMDSNGNSRADCVVVPSCTVSGGGLQCSGNNLYTCVVPLGGGSVGLGLGHACSASGTCTTTATGGTGCYLNGSTPCAAPGTASCSAGTLQSCTAASQQINYNCTVAGGSCAAGGAGAAGCVSPGCALTSSCTESCDTATGIITACVGGAPYQINCTQYGFSGCGGTAPVYCQ